MIAVACAASIATAEPPTTTIDANKILRQIPQLIDSDPAMEGAWIDVDRDDGTSPGLVVFTRVVDAAKADSQLIAIDRLIRGLVPPGQFRIDGTRDIRLPVSELRAELTHLISGDQVRFDGCSVLAMRIRRNVADGRIILAPRFRVVRQGQMPALVSECNEIMSRNPSWKAMEAVAVDTEAGQIDLVPEPDTPNPNDILREALNAIRVEPALQGAWLTVDTDDQGYPGVAANVIVFRRAFDASRVSQQAAAMDALMRRLVPNGHYRVDTAHDLKLPLSSLLAQLRRTIDMDPAFAGCRIDRALYVVQQLEAQPRFDLLLRGRVWKAAQVEAIHDLCMSLMTSESAWNNAGVGVAPESGKALKVVAPDPRFAAATYSTAMHSFWARDYAEADRLLAIASVDDPTNLVYRYWRVIGGLASGDEVQAEERLMRTIHGFRVQQRSSEYIEVLRAIYRIQGPLRLSLIAAERRAMAASEDDLERFLSGSSPRL